MTTAWEVEQHKEECADCLGAGCPLCEDGRVTVDVELCGECGEAPYACTGCGQWGCECASDCTCEAM